MKQTFKFIILSLSLLSALTAAAQSSDAVLRDKITRAVMKVYDDQLAQEPNDYNTLFARGHQHYYNGDYSAALADVNQALLLTPRDDKELRFDEYILRARISDANKDYASELADLDHAHELQPKSLACTDLIAKANLKAGNLTAAEKAFKTILRAESMNYDALYGLALVEQARGNAKAAVAQADKAVNLFRTEPQVYINRADIYARQGDVASAVNDLLTGMNVGDGGNAAQRLFDLSDTNYDGVMTALATLADRDNMGGAMYRYLRANIAMDHTRFAQALADLNSVKHSGLYDSPMVDYNIAKCELELGRFDNAIAHAGLAIDRDPSHPDSYVVMALAQYYSGDGDHAEQALETLDRCAALAPQYAPMLMTKAWLYQSTGSDNTALSYLNAALANDPYNGEALLSRVLLFMKTDNETLLNMDLEAMTMLGNDMHDLKGLALSEAGRETEALQWLDRLTSANLPGGENFYYAALFMAWRWDMYKAMEYLQKALDNGYGSLYRLRYDTLSPVRLPGDVRNNPAFDLMIDKAFMRN